MKTNPIPLQFFYVMDLQNKFHNVSGEQKKKKENKLPPICLHDAMKLKVIPSKTKKNSV